MYYLIIDTETANTIDQPLPYDIGYVICNEDGEIFLEKSFCVSEMFLDYAEMLKSAYYAEKIPNYWKEIRSHKRTLKSIFNIRKEIAEDIKTYGIKEVGAYNMGFDKRACNNDMRYLSKSFMRWFFPYGIEFFCVWNFACSTVLSDKKFIKWAMRNNKMSPKGNISTNAEVVYQYLTKEKEFAESHTGLEDAQIEAQIFAACMKYNREADRKVYSCCWQKVQKACKEWGLAEW